MEACPYDALFYNDALNKYFMCDLCAGRDAGALCVALCPVGALTLTAEYLE
jgi:Fe-S-cluster-containing hydrogenase component 2